MSYYDLMNTYYIACGARRRKLISNTVDDICIIELNIYY